MDKISSNMISSKNNNLLKFLGSIKLAIPVLTIIILVLIIATFYESQVGSTLVQQEVYKSPWFGFLMFLLALNLTVSALTRYPWKGARKVGFALTHIGLVVIIAGSAGVIHLGREGLILLHTDSFANNQVRVEGELLEVINQEGKLARKDLLVKPDGTLSKSNFASLSLLGYEENTVKTYEFVEGGSINNPAVQLTLSSARMGQDVQRWLGVYPNGYSQVDLGPTSLQIQQIEDKQEWEKIVKSLSEPQKYPLGKINLSIAKKIHKTLDVQKNLHQTIRSNSGLEVTVIDFWQDFRLDKNNQPTNGTSQFKNPAIALEINTQKGTEKWFVFANNNFSPVRTLVSGEAEPELSINYDLDADNQGNFFQVLVSKNNKLYYIAKSSQGIKSGELPLNQPIKPGWLDFEITTNQLIPQAKLERNIVPANNSQIQGIPALLVADESGEKTWLPWGEPTTISNNENGEIYASFGPKLMELPFSLALEDFIVERNEGSESVAMWTSKIAIVDEQNDKLLHRKVWMNHPTWYHGWKIAQASWNPGDLSQSTLQVKLEPAWITALTWTGSALVVAGISWIFYGPILSKSMGKLKNNLEKELELSQP